MRRTKFSTVSLLNQIFGETEQYENLKQNPRSPEFQTTKAKIEVKLLVEWEKAKTAIKEIEERSVKASEDLQLIPIDADKHIFTRKKNILSIIRKLKQKFSIKID